MLDYLIINPLANYRWILGHWARELSRRLPGSVKIYWVPVSSVRRDILSRMVMAVPIPDAHIFYFTSANIFKVYFSIFQQKLSHKSIVLYTHHTDDLGTIEEQVSYLKQAKKVHFMCSHDLNRLVDAGLPFSKSRLVLGAVDDEFQIMQGLNRTENSILLSSRFGPRKGAEHLKSLIETLPTFSFSVMGPGWDDFISKSKLENLDNFRYVGWQVRNRARMMSSHEIFLSLSSLEGGPIPILEALKCGMYVVATDTGFARDVLSQGITGAVIDLNDLDIVSNIAKSISEARFVEDESIQSVKHLSWSRMAHLVTLDSHKG